jgi:hypothetical protein
VFTTPFRPYGVPRFPFYSPRRGRGLHKREKTRQEEGPGAASPFFSYRRVSLVLQMMMEAVPRRDPVRHWCYRWASSGGHGVPSYPGAWHGQQAPLMGAVQRLGSTVPVCPALLATCAPRHGPSWPRVASRHACSLLDIRSMVPGPCHHTRSACALVRGWIRFLGLSEAESLLGVRWDGIHTLGVGRGGAGAQACALGVR